MLVRSQRQLQCMGCWGQGWHRPSAGSSWATWALLLLLWCQLQPSATLNVGWEYAVIIDAGSTGSRAHVMRYYVHKDSPWPSVELPDAVHRTSPGLSAYAFEPKTAANSLEPLIKFAKEKVPPDKVAATPIQLMGTAGLRALPNDTCDKVLAAVRGLLGSSGFRFQDDYVRLLGGEDEGLWGWLAVNYATGALQGSVAQPVTQSALGRKDLPGPALGNSSSPAKAPPLMGLLELGGGSMQIAFTPSRQLPEGHAAPVALPGIKQQLFTHSFQGWGMQAVAARWQEQLLGAPGGSSSSRGSKNSNPAKDPCLLRGYSSELGVVGSSDWAGCLAGVRALLPGDKGPCSHAALGGCSGLGDVWAPPLEGMMLGLDNLYYTGRMLGLGVGPNHGPVSLAHLERGASRLCSRPWSEVKAAYLRRTGGAGSEAHLAKVCFSSALILALLRDGLHMEPNRPQLQLSNAVVTPRGVAVEVNWALGALLVEVLQVGGRPLSAAWLEKEQAAAAAATPGEGVGARLVQMPAAAAAAVMSGGFSDSVAGVVALLFCLTMMLLSVVASWARVGVIGTAAANAVMRAAGSSRGPAGEERGLLDKLRYQKLNRSMLLDGDNVVSGSGESPVAAYHGHEAVVIMQTGRRQQG